RTAATPRSGLSPLDARRADGDARGGANGERAADAQGSSGEGARNGAGDGRRGRGGHTAPPRQPVAPQRS
ncbi:MAG: hypothetical protein V3T97_05365, partial [Gemmatimonadota bacterium]